MLSLHSAALVERFCSWYLNWFVAEKLQDHQFWLGGCTLAGFSFKKKIILVYYCVSPDFSKNKETPVISQRAFHHAFCRLVLTLIYCQWWCAYCGTLFHWWCAYRLLYWWCAVVLAQFYWWCDCLLIEFLHTSLQATGQIPFSVWWIDECQMVIAAVSCPSGCTAQVVHGKLCWQCWLSRRSDSCGHPLSVHPLWKALQSLDLHYNFGAHWQAFCPALHEYLPMPLAG